MSVCDRGQWLWAYDSGRARARVCVIVAHALKTARHSVPPVLLYSAALAVGCILRTSAWHSAAEATEVLPVRLPTGSFVARLALITLMLCTPSTCEQVQAGKRFRSDSTFSSSGLAQTSGADRLKVNERQETQRRAASTVVPPPPPLCVCVVWFASVRTAVGGSSFPVWAMPAAQWPSMQPNIAPPVAVTAPTEDQRDQAADHTKAQLSGMRIRIVRWYSVALLFAQLWLTAAAHCCGC
eukprot:COSAG06_NODE_6582_length_2870_cov_1.899314_4_plen_239_part_00